MEVLYDYRKQRDEAAATGTPHLPLEEDVPRTVKACRSRCDGMLGNLFQIVSVGEGACEQEGCGSTLRTFNDEDLHFSMHLSPVAFRHQQGPVYLEELLRYSFETVLDEPNRLKCRRNPAHRGISRYARRIVRAPPVLLITLDRANEVPLSANPSKPDFKAVEVQEELDLRPWMEQSIPSVALTGDYQSRRVRTKYTLTGVARYMPGGMHYATFCKIPLRGDMRWLYYDSLEAAPRELHPLRDGQVRMFTDRCMSDS